MRRTFKWDKKYLHWGVTAFLVIACAVLFYMALNYIGVVGLGLKKLMGILSPFIWGLIITWLIDPMVRTFRKELFLPLTEKIWKKNAGRAKNVAKALAILLGEIVFLAIIAALVYLIVPQLYQSIETIVKSSDTYITNLTKWVETVLNDYPEIESYALDVISRANESLVSWLQSTLLPELGSFVSSVTAGVYYVLKGVYNLLIGIIASMYILSNLENFSAGAKRWVYSAMTVENAKKLLDGLKFVNRTFVGFINGKLLDSAIIGLICYVCCALMKMPYTLLISVIVGVTNVIPFFGPFIGAIPSTIIILMVSPMKALVFVIFIVILQQVDGNIIGPKILGSTTGINGFWVLFSIIIGAGLFGFWGMLLGVPVFVVIQSLFTAGVERRLKNRALPCEVDIYRDMDYIDPVTFDIVEKKKDEDEDGLDEPARPAEQKAEQNA